MSSGSPVIRKPKALRKGDTLAFFAPASPPADPGLLNLGLAELRRLGFEVVQAHEFLPSGYFAASPQERVDGFLHALRDESISGLVALRGGYGSTYLLDLLLSEKLGAPKCVIGYSDLTALQTFLWQRNSWVTFHGPMLLSGFDHGPDDLRGYDEDSFVNAVTNTSGSWSVNLNGESLVPGTVTGRILGGCLTLLQTTLGTPWEIETNGAILLLEDTHMKPYQLDRALMHLKQAGKFGNIRGIVLGEFPGCPPPIPGSPTVRWVCEQILAPLGVPVVYGAAIGHTPRAMLTIPLGVNAELNATGEGQLNILESAVLP
jgi:muramoyltetrapeptide carboxypeptidase